MSVSIYRSLILEKINFKRGSKRLYNVQSLYSTQQVHIYVYQKRMMYCKSNIWLFTSKYKNITYKHKDKMEIFTMCAL